MTIRKRNDSVKPGKGIDGNKDVGYDRQHIISPWDSNPAGNYKSPKGAGKYQDANADFLTNKLPADPTGGEVSYDIWSEVEGQSGPNDRKIRSRGQP
jgi:hypothetical protein